MSSPIPNEVSDLIIGPLKKYKWAIIIVAACVVVGYLSVLVLGKNNPIELEIEKVIEIETGLNVNLTP